MNSDIIEELKEHHIYPYGSDELLKLERNMTRYFEREYTRWSNNSQKPEDLGCSSYEGNVANLEKDGEAISHYDHPIGIYKSFLDKEYLVYTMGLYGFTADVNKYTDIPLSLAQINKFDLVIERADIHDGHDILELGCGFGGFSKYLLHTFPNLTITALNPSSTQTDFVNNLVNDMPSQQSGRFRLLNLFASDVTPEILGRDRYDRIISLGLLESVRNLDKFFRNIFSCLKSDGKSFHHCIVSKDLIPQLLHAEKTLISEYYPAGIVWPYGEIIRHEDKFVTSKSWFINGLNYWKTIDAWHSNFWLNIDSIYPSITKAPDINYWNQYFVLCKAMFRPCNGTKYGNGHYLFCKS